MKRLKLAILALGIPGLGLAWFLFVRESPVTLEIPAELKSAAGEIPTEQNRLTVFLDVLGECPPEQTKKLREAIERLKSGKGVEDEALLQELSERHKQADEMLAPPLAFSQSGSTVGVPLLRVFQGAEVLARQAMIENDSAGADRVIADLLRWSHLLRNGHANQMQWLIARYGWKTAFDLLLQDLPAHADPSSQLGEIDRLFHENRIETAELIECLKMEIRWWKAHGGLKAMLNEPDGYMMTVFFNPPFNDISSADLHALPYDVKADFRRETTDLLGILDCLKRGVPIAEWSGCDVPTTGRTLEDYRKRSNGLGDLFYEQQTMSIQKGFWANALSQNRLMEACLLWLKQEGNGASVSEDLFKEILDPVDGKPMSVDISLRTIRCRGSNMTIDAPEAGALPIPAGGFWMSGDDVVIVVPRLSSSANPERP